MPGRGADTAERRTGPEPGVTVFLTQKAVAYGGIAAIGCAFALLLHQPAIIAFVAPMLAALVLGFAAPGVPAVDVSLDLDQQRVLEGESITVAINVQSAQPAANLEVALRLPTGLLPEEGEPVWSLDLTGSESQQVAQQVICTRWGGYALGDMRIRVRDAFGFFVRDLYPDLRVPLRVYPQPAALQSVVSAANTHIHVGSEVARARDEGLEFADIRAYGPGDRIRRINWRLSSRRQELFVNDYHREQNHNVVLLLDTFGEESGASRLTLERSVRAAATLAEQYLQRRDQVGVVGFGGRMNWLQPETGMRQRYRIIESLIEAQAMVSYADRAIDIVPPRMLPANAFVIALTPLLDERLIAALINLHGRRFDLAVIEIPALDVAMDQADQMRLARRIWAMEREALRDRFRMLGVPIAVWNDDTDLESVMQEVQVFRRYARRLSA